MKLLGIGLSRQSINSEMVLVNRRRKRMKLYNHIERITGAVDLPN